MEILTKSLLNISESIGIPRNPLLAINQNISNLTYNPLPINSYPSFPPAPQRNVPLGAFFCGAGGSREPFFSSLSRTGGLRPVALWATYGPVWGLFCGAEGSREPFFSSLQRTRSITFCLAASGRSHSRTRSPQYYRYQIGTK